MRAIFLILFFIGLILLGINTVGLVRSLRSETLENEITPYKNDVSIPFADTRNQWNRMENEPDKEFALRMNILVNKSMAHYWGDEGIRKYHMQIPLWENYVLSARQFITGEKKYEFRNYKKAIERGVGICSQPCIALQNLLHDHGIRADLWDLKGHVVVEAAFRDGKLFILDPDYGKYVPYGMAEIQQNPELVRPSYMDQDNVYADHVTEHKHTDDIVRLYEEDGNHVYTMAGGFEDFSYYAMWILPVILMLPGILTGLPSNKIKSD